VAGRERTWTWEWWFDAPPSRVWAFVSDTDRMDRLAGLPPGTYAPVGGAAPGTLSVRQSFLGLRVAYEETPFEWVEPEHYDVVRTFWKGPVAVLRVRAELRPDDRGTRVSMSVTATPRGLLSALVVPFFMRRTRRGLDRAFRELEAEIVGGGATRPARRSVLAKALGRFERLGDAAPKDLAALLSTHVASADEADLRRIRPFALADRWRLPRRDVLAATLLGVRAGVLELSWESLCPHCRGGKRPVRSLAQVASQARCDACAVDFELEFDKNLEAVFRPASDLRRVGSEVYCLAGPARTPHVLAQVRLAPGTSREASVALEPGAYRVRVAAGASPAALRADDESAISDVGVEVSEAGPRLSTSACRAGPVRVSVRNSGPKETLALLERVRWLDDVATAMDVVAVPCFRDLFASEVLARHERIAVNRVAILFTDLKGSTALYRGIGDAAAYALVREHFRVLHQAIARHGGVLVKTIGDAVMASFRSAEEALSASFDMHRVVAAMPAPDGSGGLVLKAGLHCGPSIVVNASDRIDYFGTTTNLAARAQVESAGGDVVVTDAVLADEEARRALEAVPHRRESFRASLKGFPEDVLLHRLVPGGGPC
jgi:class 3 adenylate cyclase